MTKSTEKEIKTSKKSCAHLTGFTRTTNGKDVEKFKYCPRCGKAL